MKIEHAKHKPHVTFGRIGELVEDQLGTRYPRQLRKSPSAAGGLSWQALNEAVLAYVVKEPGVSARFMRVAMDCAEAAARGYANLGQEIAYQVDGHTYHAATLEYGLEMIPRKVVRIFSMAIALRHAGAMQQLSRLDPNIERKMGGAMDEGPLLFSDAYRAFWRRDANARAVLDDAGAHLEPSQLRVADPRAAARYSSCIPAMVALLDNDEVAFNQSLFEGVKAHKAWWGRGERLKDPEGFWAALPLALAVMAHDRGMPVRVESDYIPRWFIEGTDPK